MIEAPTARASKKNRDAASVVHGVYSFSISKVTTVLTASANCMRLILLGSGKGTIKLAATTTLINRSGQLRTIADILWGEESLDEQPEDVEKKGQGDEAKKAS